MKPLPISRREFVGSTLAAATATTALLGAARPTASHAASRRLHLSTNSYSWQVFYQREGKDFGAALDTGLADVRASEIEGYEPGLGTLDDLRRLEPALKTQGLEMRSLYVGSILHDRGELEKSLGQAIAVAREAREKLGTRIVVTNPNPIQWGGAQSKSDAQLRAQAQALNRLGRELKSFGVTLAYHNHDIELRHAAREFHHMLAGTDPDCVKFCLDAHWVYRGSGNSQVALFDVIRLYGSRIVELHLRQSQNGVWSETLGPGDIDYPALAEAVLKAGARPHLVLEIAVENGTPRTLSPREAHLKSAAYAREVFAALPG